jgi:hypothetical protein
MTRERPSVEVPRDTTEDHLQNPSTPSNNLTLSRILLFHDSLVPPTRTCRHIEVLRYPPTHQH